jgi:threonine synthase
VPTGNFGDILAGYYAKKLGLPIKKLICASNQNNVLTDFFKTGKYDRNRPFFLTNSPSMDILVSSNLERLLFDAAHQDETVVQDLMQQLAQTGAYQISDDMRAQLADFAAGFASEADIQAEIKRVYETDGYAIDPHTAVASAVAHRYQAEEDGTTPMVVLSTASPYKFPETVLKAITEQPVEPGLKAVNQLNQLLQDTLPAGVRDLFELKERAEVVVEPDEMKQYIQTHL